MKDAPLEPGQEIDVGVAEIVVVVGEVVLAAWFALVMEDLDLVDVDLEVLDLRDLARMSAPILKAGMLGLAISGGAVSC